MDVCGFIYSMVNVDRVNVQNNNSSREDLFNYAAGGVAGWGTYRATKAYAARPYGRYFLDSVKKIPEADHKAMWDAAQDVFAKTDLAKKGVTLKYLDASNAEAFADDVLSRMHISTKPRKKIWYYLFGETKAEKLKRNLKQMGEGGNACYIPGVKTVAVNAEKMGFSGFHEMGHALNHTGKGIGNALHKTRHLAALAAPAILAYCLLTNKKENARFADEKAHNFVKDNCGLLMFGCMVPTLMEEGLASIKGAKFAKDVLSKDMHKTLCKTYTKAWGTYALSAALIGACGALAVYVRDKVVNSKKQTA